MESQLKEERLHTQTLSKSSYVENDQITVTISGGSGHQGLMVQARKSNSDVPVGTFSSPSTNTKTSGCTKPSDTWTHSSQTNKQTSTVVWTAPGDVGPITFLVTVAQMKTVYWLNVVNPVINPASPPTTNAAPTPPPTMVQTPTTATATETTQELQTKDMSTEGQTSDTTPNGGTTQVSGNVGDNGNGSGKNRVNKSFLIILVAMAIMIFHIK